MNGSEEFVSMKYKAIINVLAHVKQLCYNCLYGVGVDFIF